MTTSEADKKDIQANQMVAAMSYIWILCLVPLFLKRKSKFCQFHAKQGLLLFVIEIVGSIIYPIPILGWALFVITLALAVLGIKAVLEGKYWEMPFLGQYAKKLNL